MKVSIFFHAVMMEFGYSQFFLQKKKAIHPALHVYVGGKSGEPVFTDYVNGLNCSMYDSLALCEAAFEAAVPIGAMTRQMGVRDGCVTCDKNCTLEMSAEECGCRCNGLDTPWCDPVNAVLRMGVFYLTEELEKVKEFLTIGVCGKERAVGDYLDAAAAALDPIFWPIHGNIDRYLVSWRLKHPSTPWNETGFTFPSKDINSFPDFRSATNIIHPGTLYAGVTGIGDGNLSGVCEGVGLHDEIAKGSFINVLKSISNMNSPHTNIEVLESVDVELNEIWRADYIYDRYEEL